MVDIAEICAWAKESGDIARGYFNNVARERKADTSIVTQADREIEAMLRVRLREHYPDHGVMGEEGGIGEIDREFVWSLDPLDGTAAFVAGLPLWCVSIGLLRRGEPYLGVIYVPMLNDCYWADAEGPAYWNGKPIRVSDVATFDASDWIAVPSNVHRRYRVGFPGKIRSLSTVAADFCYVARGSAVGALVGRANLWDLAGGLALLRAAGGVLMTLSGKPQPTAELLDGRKISEPLLLGPPQLMDALRASVERVPV